MICNTAMERKPGTLAKYNLLEIFIVALRLAEAATSGQMAPIMRASLRMEILTGTEFNT